MGHAQVRVGFHSARVHTQLSRGGRIGCVRDGLVRVLRADVLHDLLGRQRLPVLRASSERQANVAVALSTSS